jgi:hypothetical protein
MANGDETSRRRALAPLLGTAVVRWPSRVVLPVFFGQIDARLTSKRGFDTMSELNPQVARDLDVLASSASMVVQMYILPKNYRSEQREKLIKALSSIGASTAGRQFAKLFHFDDLTIQDGTYLAPGLALLELAERLRNKPKGGS